MHVRSLASHTLLRSSIQCIWGACSAASWLCLQWTWCCLSLVFHNFDFCYCLFSIVYCFTLCFINFLNLKKKKKKKKEKEGAAAPSASPRTYYVITIDKAGDSD